jgi:hypothetical protein
MRRPYPTCCWLLLVALAACSVPARADAVELRPVRVLRLVGLPADSILAKQMAEAFQAELDRGLLPLESRDSTSVAPNDTLVHAFRVVDAAPEDLAWTVDVSVRVPPPTRISRRRKGSQQPTTAVSNVRLSRGLIVVVSAHSPPTVSRPANVGPRTYTLYFTEARRIAAATLRMPGGGYAYPWDEAGLVVARAALECLAEAAGDLPRDEQADLAPTVRLATAEAPE